MADMTELVEVFCKITQPEEMIRFFDEIFTQSERSDLTLRWQLLKMLHEEIPQRTIAQQLQISLCKITRGAKYIKDANSITRKYLDQKKNESNVLRK
ncbi:MAG: hypothetical protein JW795_03475 [Chitinivibrionales bacterium]|nr:hypothetical protein [Chitinivibrionales bacterium]